MSPRSGLRRARRRASLWLGAKPWIPDHAQLLRVRDPKQAAPEGGDLDVHLRAVTGWLEHCHDASHDGGLPGRYRLNGGWSASYPETTGYAIPTLLRLAEVLEIEPLVARAERCVAFLLRQQRDDGAFPGGEVGSGGDASVFNTAQILAGLDTWDIAHDNAEVHDAACVAADWLVRVQHDDGAWRDFTYGGLACAYYAHASCWLARFGRRLDEPRYTEAAARQVEWVLGRQDEASGWFEGAGFPRDHPARVAETHTIGYTLWGLLESADALELAEAAAAARLGARRLADRITSDGWLAGRFDHLWRPISTYSCLTGNAQLALVWQRLAREEDPNGVLASAADTALRLVLAAQPLESKELGIRGGIPGSTPIGGNYLPNALPNWAAKFVADTILDRVSE